MSLLITNEIQVEIISCFTDIISIFLLMCRISLLVILRSEDDERNGNEGKPLLFTM